MKPLPFTIYRLPDGIHVIHESRGGIRAATGPEVLMWKALGKPITRPPK